MKWMNENWINNGCSFVSSFIVPFVVQRDFGSSCCWIIPSPPLECHLDSFRLANRTDPLFSRTGKKFQVLAFDMTFDGSSDKTAHSFEVKTLRKIMKKNWTFGQLPSCERHLQWFSWFSCKAQAKSSNRSLTIVIQNEASCNQLKQHPVNVTLRLSLSPSNCVCVL